MKDINRTEWEHIDQVCSGNERRISSFAGMFCDLKKRVVLVLRFDSIPNIENYTSEEPGGEDS